MPRLKAWRTDGRLDVTDCLRRFARPQNSNTTASSDCRKSWPLELQSTRCAARVRHLAASVVPARPTGRFSGRSTDSRPERAFAPPRLESPVEGLAYRDYRKSRRENLFRGLRPDAAVDGWLTHARVPWTRPFGVEVLSARWQGARLPSRPQSPAPVVERRCLAPHQVETGGRKRTVGPPFRRRGESGLCAVD
jgi:hypothetical protein